MAEQLAAGDTRALARAISLVESGTAAQLLAALEPVENRSLRIGLTGSPGAGKSTLADAVIRHLRGEGERVAVIAVDPTSPYTGGALLGDRIRMVGFAGDPGVYIRSMASRGEPGGVALGVAQVIRLLEAAGFTHVIVETVGVGQDEVAVSSLVDVTVLVLVPGTGDDIQSLKAGIMEAADVYAVNKADLPGATDVEAGIHAMQSLRMAAPDAWIPPVIRTKATTGEGVPKLITAVRAARKARSTHEVIAVRDEGGLAVAPRKAPLTLDHLGIAVRSIAAARTFYEALGLAITHEEIIPYERVKTAMLPLTGSRLELLEPTSADSTIGRFLERRGEGLHHIALRVERLDERFRAMQAAGVRLASDQIRTGAGGHRYFFIHPAATGGVLVELVGD